MLPAAHQLWDPSPGCSLKLSRSTAVPPERVKPATTWKGVSFTNLMTQLPSVYLWWWFKELLLSPLTQWAGHEPGLLNIIMTTPFFQRRLTGASPASLSTVTAATVVGAATRSPLSRRLYHVTDSASD
ncbi:hypothetical protein SKAU_G00429150 [Synaphobranchus kaupii]|uniref:Uncharacterized protein n=1 Tax=Synaphobranchus kaupii TaxID=118154 RepID=A0A9Q1E4I1_SYNKA|nr:hypothetical protein SKAU_G00429150 [Synaphobranchus kaupii]